MEGGLLSLKWNNHSSTFFHMLSNIRNQENYCDVTLTCDDKFYPVHKFVLSTCSEYFEHIFSKIDCKHPVIILKDIKTAELEALLNYMYLGEVHVLQTELSGLIKAAECLRIKGLAVPDEAPPPTRLPRESGLSGGNKRSASSTTSNSTNASQGSKRLRHGEERGPVERSPHMASPAAVTAIPHSSGESRLRDKSLVVPSQSQQELPVKSSVRRQDKDPASTELSQQEASNHRRHEPSMERLRGRSEGPEGICTKDEPPDDRHEDESSSQLPENATDGLLPIVKMEDTKAEEILIEDDDLEEDMGEDAEDDDIYYEGGGPGAMEEYDPLNPNHQHSMEDLLAHAMPGTSGSMAPWGGMDQGESSQSGFEGFGPGADGTGAGPSGMAVVTLPGGLRCYQCTLCGRAFNRKHHLNYHSVIHTGARPFSCPQCGQNFSIKSNMLRHARKAHSSI